MKKQAAIAILLIIVAGIVILIDQTIGQPQVTPQIVSQYITADTLDELVAQSPLIIKGMVLTREESQYNLARNPENLQVPAPDLSILATFYQVQVQQVLKGTAATHLWIVQGEKFILPTPPNAPVKDGYNSDGVIPLSAGDSYLFFIKEGEDYPDAAHQGYYVGVVEPWRFLLKDGQALVQTTWDGGATHFAPIGEEELINKISTLSKDPLT